MRSSSLLARGVVLCAIACASFAQSPLEQQGDRLSVLELEDGTIVATDADGTQFFGSWQEYFSSPFFQQHGMRCAQDVVQPPWQSLPAGTADCTYSLTNPKPEYDPSVGRFCIPVVVHVIESTGGSGHLSDAQVQSQIDILNEDYLAIPGTNGAPGTNVEVQFALATVDPSGNPTNGITRHVNNTWYNDGGGYQSQIAWDTCRYLNLYTNTASGYLGYSYIPNGGGVVCQSFDGCVIHWQAFGRNSSWGPPYNQGRTATHEVGHYLGLFHTFDGGCGTNSCYTTGDLICDTNKESNAVFGCPGSHSSCSSADPYHNYMDYTDDLCMWEFTPEQARRVRCTIEHWRPALFQNCGGGGPTLLFYDTFESGGYAAGGWTTSDVTRCKVVAGAAYSGGFGARLRKGGEGTPACQVGTEETWIQTPPISTVGYANVELRMAAHFRNNELSCEFLDVQWWTGSAWQSVAQIEKHQWQLYTIALPAGAANNPALQLRLITNAKGQGERAEVDDFQIYGQ